MFFKVNLLNKMYYFKKINFWLAVLVEFHETLNLSLSSYDIRNPNE